MCGNYKLRTEYFITARGGVHGVRRAIRDTPMSVAINGQVIGNERVRACVRAFVRSRASVLVRDAAGCNRCIQNGYAAPIKIMHLH